MVHCCLDAAQHNTGIAAVHLHTVYDSPAVRNSEAVDHVPKGQVRAYGSWVPTTTLKEATEAPRQIRRVGNFQSACASYPTGTGP